MGEINDLSVRDDGSIYIDVRYENTMDYGSYCSHWVDVELSVEQSRTLYEKLKEKFE